MLTKQLQELCIIDNCFLYEGRVYELLKGRRYKYRVMISEDDYDYVESKKLKRELDRFLARESD